MAVRQGNRRKGFGLRQLLTLVALVAGIAWAYHALYGSSGSSAANAPHRMVGAQSGTQLAVANGAAQGGTSRRLAGATATAPSAGAALPTAAHDGHAVVALSTRTVPAGTPAVAVRPGNAARYGVPSVARIPLPTARRADRATMTAHLRVATPVVASPLKPLPVSYLLRNDYQVYETWNNCGPASLSMALSYFGIQESQAALGQVLRPYQNPNGDNDDKDVTLDALAGEARTLGLLAYSRPNGSIQLLKRFVANGMPVIAETTMTIADDIGHYRVVKGFDDAAGTILQDDSMQGHNIQFSYADFDAMWKKYNYEYLVLVPKAKQALAEAILGSDLNEKVAWQQTVLMDEAALVQNPDDVDSRFNLSVALYYAGAYKQSVDQFEKVQNELPFRTLWYQIEPIEAYYALGDYGQVFTTTDSILNNGNRAFSQLYILRGEIDKKEGHLAAAKAEFEKAVYYNTNLKAAQDALRSVSG